MKRKSWGPEQDEILLRHYGKMPNAELVRTYLPGWGKNTVRHHAAALGLTRKQPVQGKWTPDEDAVLRQWHGKIPVKEIKRKYLPRRTESAVYSRAVILGLTTDSLPWTEDEDETIREYYARLPIHDLAAKLPGRTLSDIRTRVRALGLERSQCNTLAWNEYRRLTDGGTHGTNFTLLEKKKANRNNTTGIRGVSFHKRSEKYRARIQFQGSLYNLGEYATLEEAAKARAEAMAKLQPILDAIKTDIAGMKDELVARAVRTAAELRQANRESRGDAPRSTGTAP